jgi:hypothetical protein
MISLGGNKVDASTDAPRNHANAVGETRVVSIQIQCAAAARRPLRMPPLDARVVDAVSPAVGRSHRRCRPLDARVADAASPRYSTLARQMLAARRQPLSSSSPRSATERACSIFV